MTNSERYGPAILARREMIAKAGREGDRAVLETLGGFEQYDWHEARKTVDPEHINPYSAEDRRRFYGR